MKLEQLIAIVLFASGCAAHRHQPAETTIRPSVITKDSIDISTFDNRSPHSVPLVIAALPIHNATGDKTQDGVGGLLADLLTAKFAAQSHFKVVERHRISEVIDELHLVDAGPFDQDTAVKVGHLLGANVLVIGDFSRLGERTVLTLRLVKVETGEVIGGVTRDGIDPSQLRQMTDDAGTKLVADLSAK
ncbi:MAG TPA: CsgG/HfaB family protein [Elusimicrobiota bacterium]|nr:CsgG/HfaB family protein [Elusimicrobiota bacterium]